MKVLGIDPGYGRCGYAVIQHEKSVDQLIIAGCIETQPKDGHNRLLIVGTEIARIIIEHAPHIVAIEKLYFTKNISTGIGVAEARGVSRFVARSHNLPIIELGPSDIKIALTGRGNADKRAVALMVQKLLSLPSPLTPDDASDAAAIAITGAIHNTSLHYRGE